MRLIYVRIVVLDHYDPRGVTDMYVRYLTDVAVRGLALMR
jgi:hypothetical protein